MGSDQGRAEPRRTTKWTDWKGLPGHTQVHKWMRDKADWKATPVAKGDKNSGADGSGARLGGEDADRELRTALHEARADRPDDRRW